MTDVLIVAISFMDEDLIQIQYAETRDRSPAAAVQRSIIIDTQYLEGDELETLLDAAKDLVDKGLLLIRNPPSTRSMGGETDDDIPETETAVSG